MNHRKKLFQIISCALSLALLGSCASAPEKTVESTTIPKTESLPSYSEDSETTSYSETIETSAPETSTEDSIMSSNSEEPTLPKTEDLPSYSEKIETTAPETSAKDASFSGEPLTEEMLEALLEKNREFHGMFMFFRGTKWLDISDGSAFEIEFNNYDSFSDFRNSIYSTYTEEYATYLLENFLNKGEKSFFEDENGKIFMNAYIFGTMITDAFRYGRESYTFQIISSNSSVCEFLYSFRMWNEYGSRLPGVLSGEDTIVTLKCKAVREEDGWKLPYMICFEWDQTEVVQ